MTAALRAVAVGLMLLTMAGCYSFTGASVPPHLHTIAVPLFDDESATSLVVGLRERATEAIVAQFTRSNTLSVVDERSADCTLRGRIVGVRSQPEAVGSVGGTVQAQRQLLTIAVEGTFTDRTLNRQLWQQTFTASSPYETTGDLREQQDRAVEAALRQLSQDMFLKTVADW